MGAILKIAFLVCLAFVFLAPPNGVQALKCLHCISMDSNETVAADCINLPAPAKIEYFGDTVCDAASMMCKSMFITINGKKDVARGCVDKPLSLYDGPCCTTNDDPVNPDIGVETPAPYWSCFCDKDNCNTLTGDINKDNLPTGYKACKDPPTTTTTGSPVESGNGTKNGTDPDSDSSQDHPRSFSLAVLGAVCLSVFVGIPALVNNLQY